MERWASELKFISKIKPDGTGVESTDSANIEQGVLDRPYRLSVLSITEGTYIASGINSYVVKLKNPPRWALKK